MTSIEVSDATAERIEELQDEIEVKATVSDAGETDYTVPLDDEVSKEQVVDVSVRIVRRLLRKEKEIGTPILGELDEEMASTLEDRDIKREM
ncbi:MAG: hypothetical protein ACOCRA_04985 [Halobacteria archaeon]